ncbi:hypothetical protein CJA_2924 [Cellvibrio japonicus Ueda107]|uniref:Uncharacterized protein n=1 Tax=Cellvibrio japonicus (strain Ueda107) TaxID=498211 RepID=B3PCL4_CELJU|nr:hypothetical protein CJA_2924 [Cellvibrio japonicus Ueda107]
MGVAQMARFDPQIYNDRQYRQSCGKYRQSTANLCAN